MIALQLVSKATTDATYQAYVAALTARRESLGYLRFHPDVWDVPTWVLPVLRAGGKLIINDANVCVTGQVYGSVMSCNKADWLCVVQNNPDCSFILGGYVRPIVAPNVTWQATDAVLQELTPKYPHYPISGKVHGARVTLSTGCLHHCSFCTVPHERVTCLGWPAIHAQLKGGTFGMIYVDDKTFGQAANHSLLGALHWAVPNEGFIVQTTAAQVLKADMYEWQLYGVKAVEIGVESFNDDILRAYRKPHTCDMIERACAKVAAAGMRVCPNILIGLDGETAQTYRSTFAFMGAVPNLGWFNVYCLADYANDDAREDVLANASPLQVEGRAALLTWAACLMGARC